MAYDTDFDGTDLTGGSERQVDVRFASGASATLTDSNFTVGTEATASTTIANQGAGTYTVTVNGGTTTAQYYSFDNLGGAVLCQDKDRWSIFWRKINRIFTNWKNSRTQLFE